MDVNTFVKHVIPMLDKKNKSFIVDDVNKILYLYCIKSIQIKGSISPLEKFNWLATSAGPQVKDIFKLIKEYRMYGEWYDIEELDKRSKRILEYVLDKYQYDPGFQALCKGEAYYSALVDYSEHLAKTKNKKVYALNTYPVMDWLIIYREAKEAMQKHRNPDYLKTEYLKYGLIETEKVQPKDDEKVFAKLSVDSDLPLSITINFKDKEQLKNFINSIL